MSDKEMYDAIVEFAKRHKQHADDVVICIDESTKRIMIQELLPDGYDGLYTETLYESKKLE